MWGEKKLGHITIKSKTITRPRCTVAFFKKSIIHYLDFAPHHIHRSCWCNPCESDSCSAMAARWVVQEGEISFLCRYVIETVCRLCSSILRAVSDHSVVIFLTEGLQLARMEITEEAQQLLLHFLDVGHIRKEEVLDGGYWQLSPL